MDYLELGVCMALILLLSIMDRRAYRKKRYDERTQAYIEEYAARRAAMANPEPEGTGPKWEQEEPYALDLDDDENYKIFKEV